MSQQVNSSVPTVQDAVQLQAAAPAVEASLPAAPSPITQLDRIDAMLAAQRAQQAKLGLALKAAKTGTASTVSSTQADASPAWALPSLSLGEHTGWFAASGSAVVLLCAGFVMVWRGRFSRSAAAAQPAEQDSLTDSLLMVSEYNALQPWGPLPAEAAMSQPARSSLAAPVLADEAHHIDLDFDVSVPSLAWADVATAPRAPIIYPAQLTDDDAQSTVELQLAQQMADLGQIEDARALCQEVFVKGSEAMQDVALQIMTRLPNLPNVKQP